MSTPRQDLARTVAHVIHDDGIGVDHSDEHRTARAVVDALVADRVTSRNVRGLLSIDWPTDRPLALVSRDLMVSVVDQVNATRAVVAAARAGWHEARRWEDPLAVPAWVEAIRVAFGGTVEGTVGAAVPCPCQQCVGSDEREARNGRG